jgi:hypothetical protein
MQLENKFYLSIFMTPQKPSGKQLLTLNSIKGILQEKYKCKHYLKLLENVNIKGELQQKKSLLPWSH